MHTTRRSEIRLAAAMDHLVEGPGNTETSTESEPDFGRVTIAADLAAGQRLQVVKFLAYGASSQRSLPAFRDLAVAALAEARQTGWKGWSTSSARTWTTSGTRADVEVDGDTEVQQAVRFALFHMLQAGARAEQRPLGRRVSPGPATTAIRSGTPSVRPAGADLHRAATRRGTRCGGATRRSAGKERAEPARPGRRGVPLAHDPRPGVLGVLAGRHGGVPRQRRHRRRRRAVLRTRPRTTPSSARSGSNC